MKIILIYYVMELHEATDVLFDALLAHGLVRGGDNSL